MTEPHENSTADALGPAVDKIVKTYLADDRCQHLGSAFLPSRARTIQIIEVLRRIMFPGFFDEHRLTTQTAKYHVGELLRELSEMLYDQARQALRYDESRTKGRGAGDQADGLDQRAKEITAALIDRLPQLRQNLMLDVQAGFDGDPAAQSTDEIIFCYPGLDAIFIHRVAHALWELQVPLLPRIMSEYAHNETGIDIHPGAVIGKSFFIDHGTGVVIGETVQIGDRVKMYQGVTLGALSTKGGQAWRGRKRHPTIEDDVTIYPNSTILGGETVIGARCVINGGVFLIRSVPPDYTVRVRHPEPELAARRARKGTATPGDKVIEVDMGVDFAI